MLCFNSSSSSMSELLRDMSSKEKTADVPRTMTTTKTWSQSRGRRKTQNVGFFALRRHSVLNWSLGSSFVCTLYMTFYGSCLKTSTYNQNFESFLIFETLLEYTQYRTQCCVNHFFSADAIMYRKSKKLFVLPMKVRKHYLQQYTVYTVEGS